MSKSRRVILALDIAARDEESIAAAVELAARLGAEVLGLFLEDPRLLRWADLPVARQVSPWGKALEEVRLEAQLQALAAQAQAALEQAARRLGVAWRAQVLRGEPERALSEEVLQEDIWVIGTAGRVMGLTVPTPSALRLVLPEAARWVLLQPRGRAFRHPMVVLHPQARQPEAVLDTALAWMESRTEPLTVLMLGPGSELAARVQTWQAQQGVLVRPVHLEAATLEQLAQVFGRSGCDGLVLGADLPLLEGEGLSQLLALSRAPVLLVR